MLKTGRAVVPRFRTSTTRAQLEACPRMTFLTSFLGQRSMNFQPEKESVGSEAVRLRGCWVTGRQTLLCRLDPGRRTTFKQPVILQTCVVVHRPRLAPT